MRILVTGAAGSIGSLLVPELERLGHEVHATDIESLDVVNRAQVDDRILALGPDVIYHLAGAKHAPEGEQDPEYVTVVNTLGTANVVRAARGAKVIMSSTCKAADPETAYGASKLIAERIVLNANGTVIRFFNVRETAGNVFRLWEQIPEGEPIPWTDCWRFFISTDDAIRLAVKALEVPSGRYTVDPGLPQHMLTVAHELYPSRRIQQVPLRRGDRRKEPLHAKCETVTKTRTLLRIDSPYDPPRPQPAEKPVAVFM